MLDGGAVGPPDKGEDDTKGLGRTPCGGGTPPLATPNEGKPLEGGPEGGTTEPPIEGGRDP